jgi:hypothetical protein
MIFDVTFADRVLALIETQPDRWDQGTWFVNMEEDWDSRIHPCGTAGCFAGHVIMLHFTETRPDAELSYENGTVFVAEQSESVALGRAGEVAANVLGLTRDAIAPLFDGANSLAALKAGVEFLSTVDGTRPEHDDVDWIRFSLQRVILSVIEAEDQ